MRKGDIGASVANLQRQLTARGYAVGLSSIFDDDTEAALIAWQKKNGLVADGIAGPKTIAALLDGPNAKLLKEADLTKAAERLGVSVAAIKAVNEVESRGHGFLADGRPVILYERHVAYSRLKAAGVDADAMAAKHPNIFNPQRGGYAGKETEWARLASARQVIAGLKQSLDEPAINFIPEESCSWGQFQIMGYHWQALGYSKCLEFFAAMNRSEGDQLDAFVRFIEAESELLNALKTKKWATFARLYNGPAYKENLYDVKLARAFARFSPPEGGSA